MVAKDSRPFGGIIDFYNVSFICLLEKLFYRDVYIYIYIKLFALQMNLLYDREIVKYLHRLW